MRRSLLRVGLVVALVWALVGALSPGPASAQRKVVFAAGADPKSLDPAFHPLGPYDALIQGAVYDTLVFHAPDGSIRPGLATQWRLKDPTTIEFKLRRGVRYHDGTPFRAEDVKFNFERVLKEKGARWKGFIAMVKAVRVVDEGTVELKLKFPYSPILANLAIPVASIASPAAIARRGKDFRKHPAGTGPFALKKWVPGEYILFEANPHYWGGRPAIDQLEYRVVPEDTTRVLQLRAGQVHLAMYLPPGQMGEVERDPRLELVRNPLFRVVYVGMNTRAKPFDNPLVRRAVNHALDTRTLVEKVMLGVGLPIRGPYGPATWGYDPSFESTGYSFDPERGRQLLKEAGYPDGFETEFWHTSGRMTADKVAAEAIQAQLAKVGIRARLKTGDLAHVAPTIRNGKAPIFLYTYGVLVGDADDVMYRNFHSSHTGRTGNYARYKDPRVDRLLERARASMDPEQRKALYKQAVKAVVQDAPWVFFKQEVMLVGKSKKLQGVIFHPSERIYFHRAQLVD